MQGKEYLHHMKEVNKRRMTKIAKNKKKVKKAKTCKRRYVPSSKQEKIGERSARVINDKRKKIQNLKKNFYQEKEENALKECTFHPKINKRSKTKKRKISDLMNWHKEKRTKIYEKETQALKEVTLTPKINKRRQQNEKSKKSIKVEDRLLNRVKITQERIKKKKLEELEGLFTPRREKTAHYQTSHSVHKSVEMHYSTLSACNVNNIGQKSRMKNSKSTRYFSKLRVNPIEKNLKNQEDEYMRKLEFDDDEENSDFGAVVNSGDEDEYDMPKKSKKRRRNRKKKNRKKNREKKLSRSKSKNSRKNRSKSKRSKSKKSTRNVLQPILPKKKMIFSY